MIWRQRLLRHHVQPRAASSTILPRVTLINRAWFCICAKAAASNNSSVSGVNGAHTATTSDCASKSPKRYIPQQASTASGSTATIRIPKAATRCARSRPVPPKPTIPIVRSINSHCIARMGKHKSQVGARSAVCNPRVKPSKSAIACSAKCTPTVPLALHSTKSLSTSSPCNRPSTPAPQLCIHLSFSRRRPRSPASPLAPPHPTPPAPLPPAPTPLRSPPPTRPPNPS